MAEMDIEDGNDLTDSQNETITSRKGGTIFLVDCRTTMFDVDVSGSQTSLVEDDLGCSKFSTVIQCCKEYMLKTIEKNENEYFAVVLFNTAKDDPKTNTKNVTLVIDVSLPSSGGIKILQQMIEGNERQNCEKEYGLADDCSIADALWYCSSLFAKSGHKMGDKRILLFTDESEPHKGSADAAFRARTRATDMKKLQVKLHVYPMGHDMQYNLFYKELVKEADGYDEDDDSQGISNSKSKEELEIHLRRLEFSRRTYAKLQMDMGRGLSCGFSLYAMYKEAKVLPMQNLSKTTNEPVKSFRQVFDEVTGELLLPSDVTEFVNIGGGDVVFTAEEKECLKKLMEPGLTLLGFKNAAEVDEGLFTGNSSFAFPEEALVIGSKDLVKALIEQCIHRKKVMFCALTPRNGALTKYVCLSPSMANSSTPDGFHIIIMPFEDEVRDIELPKTDHIEDSLVQIARRIVKKLTAKNGFKPSDFTNPKLKKLWATLKALALEEMPQFENDSTMPDLESQSKALGDLSGQFKEMFFLNEQGQSSHKRPAPSSSSVAKKLKNTEIDPGTLDEMVKAAKDAGQVENLTVQLLKEFLKNHSINTSKQRKAEMVSEVYKINF